MILVTGATGHVGKPLVERLLKRGEKVRILTRDRHTGLKGVEVVRGDILDPSAVKKAVSGVDVIYHLAAVVDYVPVPNKLMYDVNVNGTKNILAHSKNKKVIYLSTTAVYGNNMKENPARETTPTAPVTYYGKTKIMAERLVLEKGGIVLRAPLINGQGFNQGFEFVASRIARGKMLIIGSGNNRIQQIHISDLVQALVLAKEKGRNGQVYLVAGKEVKTQKELFCLLAKHLKVEPPEKRVSEMLARIMAYCAVFSAKLKGTKPKITPDYISRIAGDKTFDTSKAERELCFRPKATYELSAREIVAEYLRKRRAQ